LLAQKPDSAKADFEKAISFNVKSTDVYVNIGSIYNSVGQHDAALEYVNTALAIEPKNENILKSRSNVYRSAGKLAEAIAEYDYIFSLREGLDVNLHNYLERANLHIENKDFDKALEDCNKLFEFYSECGVAKGLEINIYSGMKDFQKVIEKTSQLLEKSADSELYLKSRADAYFQQDEYEKALEDIKHILALPESPELTPTKKWAQVYRGLICLKKSEYQEAFQDFDQIIQLGELDKSGIDKATILYYRASTLKELNNIDGAVADYKQALGLQPNNAVFHDALGRVWLKTGQLSLAKDELTKCLDKGNLALPTLVALGVIARYEGDGTASQSWFEKALSNWDKALDQKAQPPFFMYCNKSISLVCLGESEKALEAAEEANKTRKEGQQIKMDLFDLLRKSADPPSGLDQIIDILMRGDDKKTIFSQNSQAE
jgi:tetratricopeptide (TPR) repeat protein